MDIDNPIVKLCIAGTQAEFAGRLDEACAAYRQAWETAGDDYEACIAAHYVARCQESPDEILRWNQVALQRAAAAGKERVKEFYPSLYLNMGSSYERLGNMEAAQRYYRLAAESGAEHQMKLEEMQRGAK